MENQSRPGQPASAPPGALVHIDIPGPAGTHKPEFLEAGVPESTPYQPAQDHLHTNNESLT